MAGDVVKAEHVNPYEGIYYVLDAVLFQTQIIVGRELRQKEHTWIKSLSDRVQKQEMRELLERVHSLKKKFDRDATSGSYNIIFDRIIGENRSN